jgi:hypothetical protein
MKNNTFFALLLVCRILVIPKTHMLPLSNKTTRNKAVEVRRYIALVPVLLPCLRRRAKQKSTQTATDKMSLHTLLTVSMQCNFGEKTEASTYRQAQATQIALYATHLFASSTAGGGS